MLTLPATAGYRDSRKLAKNVHNFLFITIHCYYLCEYSSSLEHLLTWILDNAYVIPVVKYLVWEEGTIIAHCLVMSHQCKL